MDDGTRDWCVLNASVGTGKVESHSEEVAQMHVSWIIA
jgi:hypothetical protein